MILAGVGVGVGLKNWLNQFKNYWTFDPTHYEVLDIDLLLVHLLDMSNLIVQPFWPWPPTHLYFKVIELLATG